MHMVNKYGNSLCLPIPSFQKLLTDQYSFTEIPISKASYLGPEHFEYLPGRVAVCLMAIGLA